MGQWRTEENGRPINATGMVIATVDMDGPFEVVDGSVWLRVFRFKDV